MKNITYMGQVFSVPDEAKFIAGCSSGSVLAFEFKPAAIDNSHYSNYLNPTGSRQWFVGTLSEQLYPCEAI